MNGIFSGYSRTDLASELKIGEKSGIREHSFRDGKTGIYEIEITSEDAAKRLGKPVGRYITVNTGNIGQMPSDELEDVKKVLSEQISHLSAEMCGKLPSKILIAGLGNPEITADALGSKTVSLITATRHLKILNPSLFGLLGNREISVIAPDVLGKTGIEAAEIIKGVCEAVKPELAVVIDSLCSKSTERLAATVQLGTSGISPGSGIGNLRKAINEAAIGVKVLAIGIPTVVDSSTLVYDALEKSGIKPDGLPESLVKTLENGRGFFVTPKDSDILINDSAALLAAALENAF